MNTTVMEREQPTKAPPAIQVLRDRLLQRRTEIETALEGSGISADRFIRTAVTAATMQSELVSDVSFQSLWIALLQACRDRLLPDGRQGVIIPYKRQAKWLPMYRGLLDRFEQSGEYKWIGCGLHREDDREFDVWLDEHGQHFLHRPGPGRGKVIETYAAAITKSGAFFVSVVSEPDMDRIRNVSRAKGEDSPWNQWTDQMRLKTALRRLCKLLPMPQPLDELLDRDESGTGEASAMLPATKPVTRPRGAAQALDHFASNEPEPPADLLDESQGADGPGESQDAGPEVSQVLIETAHERGKEAKRTGMKRTAIPGEYRETARAREAEAWRKGWDGERLDPPGAEA